MWNSKWNSKLFKIGMGILLFFLIIFVGNQIVFIFRPFIIVFETLFLSFLISGLLYYLTVPFVDWLHGHKFPRPAAIALVYFLITGLLTILVILIVPVLQRDLTLLANNIPEKIQEFHQLIDRLGESHLIGPLLELEPFNPDEIINRISGVISNALTQLATSYRVVLDFTAGILMTIVIIPFLLYHMLKEKGEGSIPALVERHAPRDQIKDINRARAEMNRMLASYVQGLGILCLVVGALAFIGFLIIGLEYALILALFIMITNVVPFLGPFIGAIPAVIIGLMESPWMMLQVLIVIIVVQQIETLLISPQIMGRKLSLSPLTIILIVLVAGRLGGLLGIILGVPIFTMLKIVVAYIYEYIVKNRESGGEKSAQ